MKRRPRTLVISGKMSYHANVTAVVYFVRKVMPLVWESLPDTQLWVVGKDPTSEIQRLGIRWQEDPKTPATRESTKARIRITGEVKDIRPYLWSASIAVAPIQYGAGIQNKVLEAMACGIPVVATPQAVRALRVRKGQDLLVANGHQEMAHSIVSLLGDSQRRAILGREGRIYVEKYHDWHLTAQTVTSIYRDTAQGLKTSRFVTSKAKHPIIPFKATASISTQE
ncbi:MAG: glycosyltransferase [Terriglobia bacterium]